MKTMYLLLSICFAILFTLITADMTSNNCTFRLQAAKENVTYSLGNNDILELTVDVTKGALTIPTTPSGKKYDTNKASNLYGLFVFLIVNNVGKAILKYPADVGQVISLGIMSTKRSAITLQVEVENGNETCALSFNETKDRIFDIVTETITFTTGMYICRYDVYDESFSKTLSRFSYYILPYIPWNRFSTLCYSVDNDKWEEIPHSYISYVIFSIAFIALITFPLLVNVLPDTTNSERVDLKRYTKGDYPYSFRMFWSYILYQELPEKCKKLRCTDKSPDSNESPSNNTSPDSNASSSNNTSPDSNASSSNKTSPDSNASSSNKTSPDSNASYSNNTSPDSNASSSNNTSPGSNALSAKTPTEKSYTLRYIFFLTSLLLTSNGLCHLIVYTQLNKDRLRDLMDETGSAPFRNETFIISTLIVALVCFFWFVTRQGAARFKWSEFNTIYIPECCNCCCSSDKMCRLASETVLECDKDIFGKHAVHVACMKKLEHSLLSWSFWKKVFNCKCCKCCNDETEETCCSTSCSFRRMVCAPIVIMFVIVQSLGGWWLFVCVYKSIDSVENSVTVIKKTDEEIGNWCEKGKRCEDFYNKIKRCLVKMRLFWSIIVVGSALFFVCSIVVESFEFMLQFIVYTLFVGSAFYSSVAVTKLSIRFVIVKILVDIWSNFQNDLQLVLRELIAFIEKKPDLKVKIADDANNADKSTKTHINEDTVSKEAFVFVLNSIKGPSFRFTLVKLLFAYFVFVVCIDALNNSGLQGDKWDKIVTSAFFLFTPDIMSKLSGIDKETKTEFIKGEIKHLLGSPENKKIFKKKNQTDNTNGWNKEGAQNKRKNNAETDESQHSDEETNLLQNEGKVNLGTPPDKDN